MNLHPPIDIARILAEGRIAAVEHLRTVTSTQDYAHRLARDQPFAGVEGAVLVIADEQTAGRGRGANLWWTAPGSLALSLIAAPAYYGLPQAPVPQASLASGVAVIDAVEPWTLLHPLGLHWPNDVFLAGKKLSGILIDVLPDGRHIVGIGLNINNTFAAAPEEVQTRATSLIQITGPPLDRSQVLLSLLHTLDDALRDLAADAETFGQRFDDLCLQIGHELTVETSGRRTTGRCAGIAPDGALLLDTLGGRQRIYSGVLR